MQISEETLINIASRVWHFALLAASVYAATNPKYAWIVPLLQAGGSAAPLK
jgi:hypothetical protein